MYTPLCINFGTSQAVASYGGDARTPAQPVWDEEKHELWLFQGTQGKYRFAMASELSSYLTTADAAKTYLGVNAKAKSAGTADTATDAVKKSGNRAALAGYEAISSGAVAVTVNASSPDDQVVTGAVTITVSDGAAGQTWQKNVVVKNVGAVVAPGTKWKWIGGKAPEMKAPSLLVCKWAEDVGFLNLAVTE